MPRQMALGERRRVHDLLDYVGARAASPGDLGEAAAESYLAYRPGVEVDGDVRARARYDGVGAYAIRCCRWTR